MFNLEQAIADWRKKMLAAGIETPVPLEELELHLREEMERQTEIGMDAQQAFDEATKSIGEAQPLKAEFKKLPEKPRDNFFRRIFGSLLIAIYGVILYESALKKFVLIDFGYTYREGSFSYANLLIGPVRHLIPVIIGLLTGVTFIAFSWVFYRDYPKFIRQKAPK